MDKGKVITEKFDRERRAFIKTGTAALALLPFAYSPIPAAAETGVQSPMKIGVIGSGRVFARCTAGPCLQYDSLLRFTQRSPSFRRPRCDSPGRRLIRGRSRSHRGWGEAPVSSRERKPALKSAGAPARKTPCARKGASRSRQRKFLLPK